MIRLEARYVRELQMVRTTIAKDTVERYIRMGLTQNQMVEQFRIETGERRQRSSFGAAILRFSIDNPRATPRYDLAWQNVPREHYCYEQRMLRALASREQGKPNRDALNGRLDAWTAEMDASNAVVHYDRDLGFFRIPREDGDIGYVRRPTVSEL